MLFSVVHEFMHCCIRVLRVAGAAAAPIDNEAFLTLVLAKHRAVLCKAAVPLPDHRRVAEAVLEYTVKQRFVEVNGDNPVKIQLTKNSESIVIQ